MYSVGTATGKVGHNTNVHVHYINNLLHDFKCYTKSWDQTDKL
jgi:hypothetical protein